MRDSSTEHRSPARDGFGRFVARVVRETGRVVCVTCCHALQNRTALVARMGRELARRRDYRTLIVDADHLDPEMHLHFGVPASPGLAQLLDGRAGEPTSIPHEVEDGLWLLPAGLPRSSPTALVGSETARAVFRRLASEYGAVVVVTPPVLSDAVGATACSGADAALLVVRKGVTRKEEAAAAAELIRADGTALRGVVIVT